MKKKGNYLVMIVWFSCFFQTALLSGVSWSASNQSIPPILSLLLRKTACPADCAGVFDGTAYEDNCGICVGGTTGKTACTADCASVFGGTAYEDNCGICVGGTTGKTACPADCAGVFGGTAYVDNCGICVGGTTGKTACTADCAGVFGGTAYEDNCGICVGGTTGKTACAADCAGVFGGTAYVDNCGICVGGNTGKTACTADCAGVFGGTAYEDNCGICVGGTTGKTACAADCAGVFGGTAYVDNCGICVGGNTGKTACVLLPDTGQTRSYTATFGEDSDYTINPPSYTDNHDGTVTDNVTGLMWQQANAGGTATYNWYQAAGVYEATYNPTTQNVCGAQTTGSHTDWRLPTKKELIGIVDYGRFYPSIDSIFTGVQVSIYWSSTTYASYVTYAWNVFFINGEVLIEDKSGNGSVRCVRGGQ